MLLILHFVFFSYSLGVMRTVEKRFGLPSYKTGLVMSASDIVQTVLVLVVGYLGRKTHKPRYLSISAVLSAIGIFFSFSPYLIFGPYRYDTAIVANSPQMAADNGVFDINSTYLSMAGAAGGNQNLEAQTCGAGINMTNSACGGDEATNMTRESEVALYLFFISSIFIGFGTSGLITLGVSFIDENSKKEDSALYVGKNIFIFRNLYIYIYISIYFPTLRSQLTFP